MEYLNSAVLFLAAVITVSVYFIAKRYTYWDGWGIPTAGTFPYGVLRENGKKYHISDIITRHYNEMKNKSPFGGLYFFINPVALILDLELVKQVLVKDFHYFQDRGFYINEKDDPLTGHLFFMEGMKWKALRAKLTPTFTSGKMKMMYPAITAAGEQFKAYLHRHVSGSTEIEMKDVLARFTTDIIGICAFGIECNSLKDPEAKFREMGKKIFEEPRNSPLKSSFMSQFRELAVSMKMMNTRDDVSEFFLNAVKETVEFREKNNVTRNDFMDLLIKMKNQSGSDQLTLNEVAAQAFVFFIAGYETSSTAMCGVLYELSLNQEIQAKARQCVRDVLARHNGVMTYEAAIEMTYIDQCINESLRKYPPVPILNRITLQDYPVPGTKHVLKKGTHIVIPSKGIQNDPDIYPNPEKYDPDRFSPEETAKRNPYTFLPFGEGPRVCIGLRFGMMQSRIGLASLLNEFQFSPCSKSVIPMDLSKKSLVSSPENVWLKVEKIA